MKRINFFGILCFAATTLFTSCYQDSPIYTTESVADQFDAERYDDRLNLFVIADSGRNGYFEQKSVAQQMGDITASIEPEVVIAAGDTHHFMGVASTQDPLWMTNFELIYSHPELMVPFLPVLGNHEYRGNTQAVIDYTDVSRRWEMPARYYTQVIDEEGTTLRLVMVDTAPLIDKYRNDTQGYPDACEQSIDEQLKWVESVLKEAQEDWVVVVGHHPVYAYTTKKEIERINLQERLDPLLRKYGVDMYVCGHIHSFQHIHNRESGVDYIVNGSASLGRDVEPIEGTVFCSGDEGFLVLSASVDDLEAMMINYKGDLLYQLNRSK